MKLERSVAFLVGAGISLNPPTSFPTAWGLIERLLRAIAPADGVRQRLQLLADSTRGDRRSPGDYIRFELLLESIKNVLDPGLQVLDFIEMFQEPNPLHFLLADRAISGDFVITTNFDSLIEQAILFRGHSPISVAQLEDFANWQKVVASGKVPVFKIHGTYFEFNGNDRQLAKQTIQATLGSVSAGVSGLILPEPKRSFLAQVYGTRQVVVAGYSGSDDLDIMPTLLRLQPPSVLWIEHDARDEPLDCTEDIRLDLARNITRPLSAKEAFFRAQLARDRASLRVFRATTAEFLAEHFGKRHNPQAIEAPVGLRGGMDQFFESWEQEFVGSLSLKHAVVGDLFYRLSRFEDYHEHVARAWALAGPSEDHRSFLATMLSKALGRLGRRAESVAWAKQALDLISSESPEHERLRCFHQLGYALYKMGTIEKSLTWFDKCIDLARRIGADFWLSAAIHDKAMIFQDRGEYSRAVAMYQESIELSSRVGDIGHVAWSLHQIGVCCFDQGLFSEARQAYFEAAKISETIGDFNHLSFTEHELGLLDFISGRILSAIRHFRRCIQIDRRTGQNEFSAVDWQHLGVAFMELGKLCSAERFFVKAKRSLEAIGDRETLIELYAYWAQMELEKQQPTKALQRAEEALEIGMDIPAYTSRVELVLGLAKLMQADQSGLGDLAKALNRARHHNIRAVLMDYAYLCCRFKHTLHNRKFLDLLSWAANLYRELGNERRLATIEQCLTELGPMVDKKQPHPADGQAEAPNKAQR